MELLLKSFERGVWEIGEGEHDLLLVGLELLGVSEEINLALSDEVAEFPGVTAIEGVRDPEFRGGR